jgi:RNA polymerase sigma-70 factor (ECF subfamily)
MMFLKGPETFRAGRRITKGMEYSAPVTLGSWRERVKRLSVPRARLEDNELVERTRAGDVRSYEELVRRYERLVGRVIYP